MAWCNGASASDRARTFLGEAVSRDSSSCHEGFRMSKPSSIGITGFATFPSEIRTAWSLDRTFQVASQRGRRFDSLTILNQRSVPEGSSLFADKRSPLFVKNVTTRQLQFTRFQQSMHFATTNSVKRLSNGHEYRLQIRDDQRAHEYLIFLRQDILA